MSVLILKAESCAFFEEGIGPIHKNGDLYPAYGDNKMGFLQMEDRHDSPQAISDVGSFIESNSQKLRNNLKRPQTSTPTFEMPSLKRTVPRWDTSFDVAINQETLQSCVDNYFNKRAGVTVEFCSSLRTWSVLINHGAQICFLSFQMSTTGTTTERKIRFSGKLENGSTSQETLSSIMTHLQDLFEKEISNNNSNNNNKFMGNTGNRNNSYDHHGASRRAATDYSVEKNRRILDMMVALASDGGNLMRQQEAIQCLAEMSLDDTLLQLLHDRGATSALIAAYQACAKDAPPADYAERAKYFAELFSESGSVSQCKHEIASFALSALSNLSAHHPAMAAIVAAPLAWGKLKALHAGFTAAELDAENQTGTVLVPCLVGSADRLRRRSMLRFSRALQASYQGWLLMLQYTSIAVRSYASNSNLAALSRVSSPTSSGGGGGGSALADSLARGVADLRVV